MNRADDHRRERVARSIAKRPAAASLDVEILQPARGAATGTLDELATLLAELLDARRRSGRG